MSIEDQRYQAYMLRLWQTGSRDGLAWRASLENAHTGVRQGFANLDALFVYLEGTTDLGLSVAAGKRTSGTEQVPRRDTDPNSGE